MKFAQVHNCATTIKRVHQSTTHNNLHMLVLSTRYCLNHYHILLVILMYTYSILIGWNAGHVEHAKLRKKKAFLVCKALAINLEFMLLWMNLDSHMRFKKGGRGKKHVV